MRYNVILSDPPWLYSDKAASGERGASFKYSLMNIDDLMRMDVGQVSADDCAMFMWVTMPMIPDAIKLMRSWGFRYKTVAFVWVKRTKNGKLFWGMGNWTRANSELCLLGVRGNIKRVNAGVHSVVEDQIREHSRKPDSVRERIVELMGDVPRLEMFARERCDGWDAFGDEIDGSIEIPSIPMRRIKFRKAVVK